MAGPLIALKLAEAVSKAAEVAMNIGEKAVESVKSGEGLQKFMKNGMTEMGSQSEGLKEGFSSEQSSKFSENTNKLDELQNKIEQSPEEVSNNIEDFSSEFNEAKTNLSEVMNSVDSQSLSTEQRNTFSDVIKQINEIQKALNKLPISEANETGTGEEGENTNNNESE